MIPARRLVLFGVVAALAATAGAAYQLWRSGAVGAPARNGAAAARAVLESRLPDLEGRAHALAQWRGRVLVVNFWATWCAPCREEIPMFVRMQERHGARGLQFVGVAIDRPEPVAAFAREFQINYPVLIGGLEAMELMRAAGNRPGVLPFTVVIDRAGSLAGRELGEVKEARLEKLIAPLF